MSEGGEYAVTFVARDRVELLPVERDDSPLAEDELSGRTLCTLISAGTETAILHLDDKFPRRPGYAAVFEIESVGAAVEDIRPGDLVFGTGPHRSFQRTARKNVLPVPRGLAPEAACFARMAGVSATTLATTAARPPDKVLVTGLGPVGNMAAQLFSLCGYEVVAVDPAEARRRAAEKCGLAPVLASVPADDPAYAGKVALVVECSGNEAAVLDGCKVVRKRGEVVLVGVPWEKRTDLSAFDVLHEVFHRYVVLRSGWEWELPTHAEEFRRGSIMGSFRAALDWLAEGKIRTEGLYSTLSPRECRKAYDDIMAGRAERLVTIFDWRGLA